MTKRISCFFLLLVLLSQSCTAWHKTAIPIRDAVNSGKTKVISNDNKYIYDQIIMKDGIFYGQNGQVDMRITNQESIVYLKNKKKAIIQTVILVISLGLVTYYTGSALGFPEN